VRGRNHRLVRRVLVPLTGFLLVLGVPATGPAQAPGVGVLQQKSAALAAQSREAVVELYALGSRLEQAQAYLARIDAQAAGLVRRQASARRRYQAARRTMRVAQLGLGRQLRILYEQEEPDPIAVVLGATSLDEAITGLENLSHIARATKSVLAQARSARTLIHQVQEELAAQVSRVQAVRARVAATAAGLEQARAERTSYLARLRREQSLTASQIASLQQRAREAQQRAQQLTRQAVTASPTATATTPTTAPALAVPAAATTFGTPTDPSEPPPAPVESVSGTPSPIPQAAAAPPRPGGTMAVYATGYCLRGSTATGLPVGPGIVAVDPTVIPLGTRMTIPGYGEGVAADTGGRIKGGRIDVWIASCAQAAAFTRAVMITFH
jgi:3D (Asp-Asp-Asp) domain-containing protein/peptidoglycan hydrolase CwlO-like protein